MGLYKPNEKITTVFSHPTAKTGITNFTTYFYSDGKSRTISSSINEISNGLYEFSFTPDEEGVWDVFIEETGDSTSRVANSFLVKSVFDANVMQNVGEENSLPGNISFIRNTLITVESLLRSISSQLLRL